MGERLGRFIGRYRAAYFTPEKMNGNVVYSYRLRPGAEEQIYQKISDITISMKAINPCPEAVFDLAREYNCETTRIYRIRARALYKLARLRYGAGA